MCFQRAVAWLGWVGGVERSQRWRGVGRLSPVVAVGLGEGLTSESSKTQISFCSHLGGGWGWFLAGGHRRRSRARS